MINNGRDATGKPEEALNQEIFKLKMERDAYKAQYAEVVKKNEMLCASETKLQLAHDHKDLILHNAFELIRKFQIELYGKSSEKAKLLDVYCKNLFDEAELINLVETKNQEDPIEQDDDENTDFEESESTKKARKIHKEQDLTKLPANTPIINIDHTADSVVPIDPNTGKKMVQIATRIERKLGKQHTVVIYNHIFPVFGPEENYEAEEGESNSLVVYPQVERILKGSMISNEILAEVITKKYLDHMPLNRQEQHFKRMGLLISRQNMKNWIFKLAARCGPLIELLRKNLLTCPLINMDETIHRVLNIDGKASDTENYEIIQVGTCDSWRVAMFSFNVKRNSMVLSSLLPNFDGTLMTDGLQSYYVAVADENNSLNCNHLACWAHYPRSIDIQEDLPKAA